MSTVIRFIGSASDYLMLLDSHYDGLGPEPPALTLSRNGTTGFAESRAGGQRIALFEHLTSKGDRLVTIEIDGGNEVLTAQRLSPPLASGGTVAHVATRGTLTLPVAGGVAAVRPKTPDRTIAGSVDPLPDEDEPDAPERPEWQQPQGAHDAYAIGAIVQHGASRWVALTADNVWKPGVSGWREVVEQGQIAAEVPLPAPEAAGEPVAHGVQVGTAADGRLTLVDPELGAGARDDEIGRELHGEFIEALDRLIAAAGRSNVVAE